MHVGFIIKSYYVLIEIVILSTFIIVIIMHYHHHNYSFIKLCQNACVTSSMRSHVIDVSTLLRRHVQ